ncbi:MAG: chlorobactene glucosyltransferase, partial [Bradymonadia bacterium]
MIFAYVCACLALFAFAMTVANVWMWRRGTLGGSDLEDVSVLIPARNEERSILKAVESVLRQAGQLREIIIYNDGSTDRTGAILEELRQAHPALIRVLDGVPLPSGWVGKPHACHRLADEA